LNKKKFFLQIHNIPFKFTDEQLRHLCRAAAGVSDQSILECRIMRQFQGQDSKGKVILGKSQGFGFVGFKEHVAALQCLKQMNNNPHIFTNERVNFFALYFFPEFYISYFWKVLFCQKKNFFPSLLQNLYVFRNIVIFVF
jgi:RNA recognition motif-containing protein